MLSILKDMASAFAIIAEPNRRAILSLLVSSQQSVGEIERQLRMPQPTVSKHLRVLREAGLVESTVGALRRRWEPGYGWNGEAHLGGNAHAAGNKSDASRRSQGA